MSDNPWEIDYTKDSPVGPERHQALEDWFKWKEQYLASPENPEKSKATFLEIRDGSDQVTSPVLTREQVNDLAQEKVVEVEIPAGSIVQDLALESPNCFKVVRESTSVALFKKTRYMRLAHVSPFVKSDNSANPRIEPPSLYVPFRVSEIEEETSV